MPNKDTIAYTSPFALSGREQSTPVLLAFSGGADSSALLDLLYKDSQKHGFPLYIAHFNHKIRGEEAERDMMFCKRIAERYSLPFFAGKADVPALAKENGMSLEAQARECRYAFFADIMKNHGIPLLATAHHANDRLESMLLHLLRGSGLSGLRSIESHRAFCKSFSLVRPLVSASREDIIAYCNKNGIEYVTDSTNSDETYLRNAIRAKIIPPLLELQPSLLTLSGRSCEALSEDEDFLALSAKALLDESFDGGIVLSIVKNAHKAVFKRALRLYFSELSSAMLESTHIEAVCSLCEKATPHSRLSLPDGVIARIENDRLIFCRDAEECEIKNYKLYLSDGVFEGERLILKPYDDIMLEIERTNGENAEKGQNFLIDCDIMQNGCYFRNRQEHDTIYHGGMNKKVKKLLCDAKVPLSLRNRLPLLCKDGEILWIPTLFACDNIRKTKIEKEKSYFLIKLKITNIK